VRKVTSIAITGASGLIGRRLVAALERRPDVTRIVGLDRRFPTGVMSTRFVHRPTDIADPSLRDALHGVDVVVHLAVRVAPVPDEAAMRAINVDGTRNVVEAAEQAGVARLIHLSSAAVYGAHPDNDVPLTESSPLRGTPGFPLSEHQRDVELWLAERAREPHNLEVAVLRAGALLGPGVDNLVTRQLEAPRFLMVRGHEPPLQFVHLDDLVSAIEHVIDHGLSGPYNVASEGWLACDQVAKVVGRGVLAVPEELAYTTAENLTRIGFGGFPPGLVAHLMHPWVMSPAKLIATGWQPRITNRAALAETMAEHAGYVSAGGIRTRWSTIGWTAAGIAAAKLVALGLLWRAWRRRRARRAHSREHGTSRR
jgi:UDP-glucose 4-epimerase